MAFINGSIKYINDDKSAIFNLSCVGNLGNPDPAPGGGSPPGDGSLQVVLQLFHLLIFRSIYYFH
jgi:hypothetical protein